MCIRDRFKIFCGNAFRGRKNATNIGNKSNVLLEKSGNLRQKIISAFSRHIEYFEFVNGAHYIVDIAKNQVNLATEQGCVLVGGTLVENTAELYIREELVEFKKHKVMPAERAYKTNFKLIGVGLGVVDNFRKRIELAGFEHNDTLGIVDDLRYVVKAVGVE